MRNLTCRACGGAFLHDARGRPRHHCRACDPPRQRTPPPSRVCIDCGRPSKGRRCRTCRYAFVRARRLASLTCSCGRPKCQRALACLTCTTVSQTARLTRICQVCGVTFRKRHSGRNKGLCCSRTCGWALNTLRAARRVKVSAQQPVPVRYCSRCATAVVGPRRSLCDPCRVLALNDSKRKQRQRLMDRHRDRHRDCQHCSLRFASAFPHGARKFCSDVCRAEAARLATNRYAKNRGAGCHGSRCRRRGVAYDKTVTRHAVAQKARWCCALCRCRVSKARYRIGRGIVPPPNAPELDHIIPLSLGGTHTWDNVQLLCRACNSAKGATAVGQVGLPLDSLSLRVST